MNQLSSIEFMYQIILNACIDFHTLIKYLLRVYSMSWTVLDIGYRVYDMKEEILALTEW